MFARNLCVRRVLAAKKALAVEWVCVGRWVSARVRHMRVGGL
jgi:hypothetical protein